MLPNVLSKDKIIMTAMLYNRYTLHWKIFFLLGVLRRIKYQDIDASQYTNSMIRQH